MTLDEGLLSSSQQSLDIVALEEALLALAEEEPRCARVVELRFYGGLSVEETAETLEVSVRTVEYDWRLARAWLLRKLDVSAEESS